MELRLEGQRVLITGAASGIGLATALGFAEAGADVVINHLGRGPEAEDVAAAARNQGVRALVMEADVSRADQVRAMFAQAETELGGIDTLVNNAGISRPQPFLSLTAADWQQALDINLGGAFHCCQAALPGMLARGDGCIVNIASELGYLGRAGFAAYASSKGALLTLTRCLAREFAPTVRVNAVAPGPVDTELLRSELKTPADEAAECDIPLQRLGRPEEVAASVVFLASPAASFYCGDVLSPNGGALMR
jgi:3-oxoacyl-[acyl-carrier protein] reductase